MMNVSLNLFDKYLRILKIEKSDPSLGMLKKIVKAHLIKVPFENISKLLFKQRGINDIPDLSTYLDGIEKYNFGGTCYSNNYYLYLLLEHIGFDVKLCGADMKNPDVHLISIAKIDDREYIIDGGYAAPFLNPLPINLPMDYVITHGAEKYVVRPTYKSGRTKVEQFSNNKLRHWYTVNSRPRKIHEFSGVISNSYADKAVFMNAVRISKFNESGSLVLKNLMFAETDDSKSVTKKLTRDELPDFICEKFGLPVNLVMKAMAGIKELKDIYD